MSSQYFIAIKNTKIFPQLNILIHLYMSNSCLKNIKNINGTFLSPDTHTGLPQFTETNPNVQPEE